MSIIFTLTAAIWLSFYAQTTPLAATTDAGKSFKNDFLQAGQLTEILPLEFDFTKGDLSLSQNSRHILELWCAQISPYNIPIYINSFAASPTGIRDLTEDSARHDAMRVAFNRGLIIKEIMINHGIDQSRFILKTVEAKNFPSQDKIIVTTRLN